VTAALSEDLARTIRSQGEPIDHLTTSIDGEPHLVFYKRLNPGSQLAPAFQVCLYPLGDALAHQQEIRWQIIGAGLLVTLIGFGASHFISGRFSAPVERLAEDSAANVEQRERAEAALELTEQKYRSIFENAVEGIFLLAPDGRFLSANPALARIFGFQTTPELVAKLDDPEHQLYAEPERLAQFLRAAAEGAVANFETELILPGGRKIWVSQNARAVRNSDGTLLHFEGTLEDITDRKRAADELLALNAELHSALATLNSAQQQVIQQERLRALGQMASGIAHDFNNTLMPILGFCELLLLSPALLGDRQKACRYLETIQTAAKDAASVVSRLREFYRPSKNDREFAPVNLKRLVEQAITLTKPKWKDQAQANGATVEVVLDLDPVPPVSGEESGLREVLTNLIFNAVDAMPNGGTLTVRTKRRGDTAALEVADTGTGMSEEVRQRCLDPFFSTKGERGTGLGLSMVFGIIQRHSGLLDLQSELGKGTTFIITLPLQEAATAAPVSAPIRKPTRALRVLVVDDEAPVRDTLGAVLAIDGTRGGICDRRRGWLAALRCVALRSRGHRQGNARHEWRSDGSGDQTRCAHDTNHPFDRLSGCFTTRASFPEWTFWQASRSEFPRCVKPLPPPCKPHEKVALSDPAHLRLWCGASDRAGRIVRSRFGASQGERVRW
jgi:PAS domain S-box-containing protein